MSIKRNGEDKIPRKWNNTMKPIGTEKQKSNLNSREKNYFNSIVLEALFKKKEVVIQEINQINTDKKKIANPRLSQLKEERRLLNAIIEKIIVL